MKKFADDDFRKLYPDVKEAVIFLSKTFFPNTDLPADSDEAMKVINEKWIGNTHWLFLAELTKKILEISENK